MAGRRTFKEPDLGFPERGGDRKRRQSGEERERPGGWRNPGARGTVCPNRGREEGEEPDGSCPDQGQKKNQSPGRGIH
ncbi:hypothetical protein NDU88_003185 [Pleurodeles waltl]|uniref:Uncharacterized protein n=1 Tax=Pleurodeles waltl TaxID=8319 RepID=A0AAV7TMQ5_PLEWA|nr:hypothetical protein NDU88_003185 [Pleurodeles waltl]